MIKKIVIQQKKKDLVKPKQNIDYVITKRVSMVRQRDFFEK